MTQRLPYCIHCGAQQLNADAEFCYRCGRPIVPVKPGRRQRPPWMGPVLVSAVILLVAAIVFARLLSGGPPASQPAAATSIPPTAADTTDPATAVQPLGGQATPPTATPPTAEIAPPRETPTPPPTETPEPTPTLANVTPEPVKLSRLAWSPDGKLLAVGSSTGAYLYDTATWQEVRFIPVDVSVPASLEDGVDDLAFSFDGALLGVAGRRVQVWRVADGGLAYEIQASRHLAASPTEGLWATAGDSYNPGNMRLWRASDGQLVREIRTGIQFVASIVFSSDGQLIASGPMVDGSPTVWRTADGQQAGQLNWGQATMFGWVDFAFRPNTSTVVAVGTDDVLLVWDTTSGGMRLLTGPNDMTTSPVVNRVSYAPDGSLFATSHSAGPGRQGGSVQLWNADGSRGQAWPIAAMPKDVAFSPDSKLLAATDEQTLYVWRLDDRTLLNQVQPVWHQGILPTPTPTPLHVGLKVPADWREYYNLMAATTRFKLRHPLAWSVAREGALQVVLRNMGAKTDGATVTRIDLMAGIACPDYPRDPGSEASVDWIRKREALWRNPGAFVRGGRWPLLIPATYAEVDKKIDSWEADSLGIPGKSSVREIVLYWWAQPDKCVTARLALLAEELSGQDRSDVSRILASIEFDSKEHPFPTATATNTPMPLALPLDISLAPTSFQKLPRDGGTCPQARLEIKDAGGKSLWNAEVLLVWTGEWEGHGMSERIFGSGPLFICPPSLSVESAPLLVKVFWNTQLVGSKEFLISWW